MARSALRSIAQEKAPATLLPAVMRRVGLADTYWRLESPLGPVFVAHSKAGISMVSRAKSGADFERSFERRYGRRAYPEKSVPPAAVRALVRHVRGEGRRELDAAASRGRTAAPRRSGRPSTHGCT